MSGCVKQDSLSFEKRRRYKSIKVDVDIADVSDGGRWNVENASA
jgi:hypothetical protein